MDTMTEEYRAREMTREEFKAFCERLYNQDYYLGKTSNYTIYFNAEAQVQRTRAQIEEFMDAINFEVKTSDPILCLGCGIGWEVKGFLSLGFTNVQGVDGSPWAVQNQVAPVLLHNLVDPLPFPDDHFQLATAIDVLEHIPTNLLPEVAKEIGRVLRPYGFLYLATIFRVLRTDVDPGHLTLQPKKWWFDLFKESLSPHLTLSGPISCVLKKNKKA